jgi:hypothetical protein
MMENFLLNPKAAMAGEKAGHYFDKGSFFKSPSWFLMISIILLVFMSQAAFAAHFKGGYFTYTYLGEGQYEILITGYWDKQDVGSIMPRYQGYPIKDNSPVTVSKTLLEDGETVEHVQKQLVTWSKPGVYQVFWRNCCRGEGANYHHNFMGLYASINYNPEVPSSSPRFNDDRSFNFNSRQKINYTFEVEDPEGHEQEFSLELPYGLSADVYDEMLESGFQVKANGSFVWENPLVGSWLVNIRQREKIEGAYTGAYIDREIIIHVNAPGNQPDKGNENNKKGGDANARNILLAGENSFEAIVPPGINIYPNPVADMSQIRIVLDETDQIKVDILDLSGRIVKELYTGNIEAKQELSLKINSKELGAAKLYIGRVSSSRGVQTFRLAIQ